MKRPEMQEEIMEKITYILPKKPLKHQTKIKIDKGGWTTVTTTIPDLMAYLQQRPEFSITERKKLTEGETVEITGTFPPGKLKELARWIEGD